MSNDLPSVVIMTRKRCKDKALLVLLLSGLGSPALKKARNTSSGVIMWGPDGCASSHFTVSDHRAIKNLRSAMRRAGLIDQPLS